MSPRRGCNAGRSREGKGRLTAQARVPSGLSSTPRPGSSEEHSCERKALQGNSGHACSISFLVGKMYLCYVRYIIKDVHLGKEAMKAWLHTNMTDSVVSRPPHSRCTACSLQGRGGHRSAAGEAGVSLASRVPGLPSSSSRTWGCWPHPPGRAAAGAALVVLSSDPVQQGTGERPLLPGVPQADRRRGTCQKLPEGSCCPETKGESLSQLFPACQGPVLTHSPPHGPGSQRPMCPCPVLPSIRYALTCHRSLEPSPPAPGWLLGPLQPEGSVLLPHRLPP